VFFVLFSYTLNIDPERHEDVLLHMRLLQAARKAAEEAGGSRGSSILLDEQTSFSSSSGPFINVVCSRYDCDDKRQKFVSAE
jgi:hypothetical protein